MSDPMSIPVSRRRARRILPALAGAPLLLVAIAAMAAGTRDTTAPEADMPDARAAELEHLVIQDCGSCHGLTLKGGLGLPLTRDALDGADPDTLTAIILDGVPGTAMPPWRPLLTEAEARWITDYLLTRKTTP